jgi:hypothetical protein
MNRRHLLLAAALLPLPALAKRQSVFLEDFGGSSNTDNTKAWGRMLEHCAAKGLRHVEILPGNYLFNSRPEPIPIGLTIEGGSQGLSRLVRAYQPGSDDEPFLHWTGESGDRGGGLRDLMLVIGDDTTRGRMVYLSGKDTNHRPQWMRFDSIAINGSTPNGNGRCWRTFEINGSNIAEQGTQGIRDISVWDCWLYRGTDSVLHISNGTQFDMRGGGCAGRGFRPRILITGGGTQLTNTRNFRLDTYIAGDVEMENCSDGFVAGNIGGHLIIKPTAGRGKSVAFVGGKVTNEANWVVT